MCAGLDLLSLTLVFLASLSLGDPSRFHSFYIVICVDHSQQIPALDIISMGRLGSNVRKTVLLSSVDSEGCVQYTSLQWTGMS